jgi:hypothetical protein
MKWLSREGIRITQVSPGPRRSGRSARASVTNISTMVGQGALTLHHGSRRTATGLPLHRSPPLRVHRQMKHRKRKRSTMNAGLGPLSEAQEIAGRAGPRTAHMKARRTAKVAGLVAAAADDEPYVDERQRKLPAGREYHRRHHRSKKKDK